MGRLEGKVAIITGGAQGMGAATAHMFAKEGAKVALGDVRDGAAVATKIGDAAFFRKLDVTSDDDWTGMVAQTMERFGAIDILVNNAGLVHFTAIEDVKAEDALRIFSVNTMGPMLGAKHCVPHMRGGGRSVILNISSVDGLRGCNGLSCYTASKWALRGLSKTQAYELGPRGIRVVSIHPGGVDTPMGNAAGLTGEERNRAFRQVPLQRIGEPEEIAAVSLFLASDEASYITGAELAVDGGWTGGTYLSMLPGAPDHLKT